jgi:hypothetical protein
VVGGGLDHLREVLALGVDRTRDERRLGADRQADGVERVVEYCPFVSP